VREFLLEGGGGRFKTVGMCTTENLKTVFPLKNSISCRLRVHVFGEFRMDNRLQMKCAESVLAL
jgi:hypothetical protein